MSSGKSETTSDGSSILSSMERTQGSKSDTCGSAPAAAPSRSSTVARGLGLGLELGLGLDAGQRARSRAVAEQHCQQRDGDAQPDFELA